MIRGLRAAPVLAAVVLAPVVSAALATAPVAAADPEILVPGCAEGQVAQPGECAPEAVDITDAAIPLFPGPGADGPLIPGAFPGANPNIPPGPTPFDFPVVIPLGVTPFNVPINLPLGPTPPGRFPFQP